MSAKSPSITLNNGVADAGARARRVPEPARRDRGAAVEAALAAGYRLIDTAAAYFNEREVGEGIRRSGIDRDEVFIETKVWISDYGYDATLHAFDKSARKLGVDRLDLLLLHQPLPSAFDRTLDAYRALEKLLADGRVRAIGVSNFMPEHLERLLSAASVVPAVNQIEVHPYFQQTALQRVHAEHGIATQAWSPIGGITAYRGLEKTSFAGPDAARHRAPARQVGGPGDAAVASPEGPLGHPEVGQTRPHRRELRRLRLRAHAGAGGRHRRARHRRPRRTGARDHHPRELRQADPGAVSPPPNQRQERT